MALFTDEERAFAEAIAALSYENPFTPARIELERRALGDAFQPRFATWSADPDVSSNNPNLVELEARAKALADEKRGAAASGEGGDAERALYADVVRFALYAEYGDRLFATHVLPEDPPEQVECYDDYERDYLARLEPVEGRSTQEQRAHLFALFFQLRRAFHVIFTHILGPSRPAAELRASVWQSIFTHDMKRYRRALVGRMKTVPTLILGPSGTGKELIARSIGLGQFLPFSARQRKFPFEQARFAAVNLSALSATLIESELFGHKKGAFTGAMQDKPGWLEECGASGAVFLDEIGELDPQIQVKLLRVLESRAFQRIGETQTRPFEGKIIAATNRRLEVQMREGAFREDLYYRLCADVIRAPALAERLGDDPDEVDTLVLFLARRLVGDEEAPAAAEEVLTFVKGELGRAYPWPGNVRELEQCVRNVLIRGSYTPAEGASSPAGGVAGHELGALLDEGALSADDLLRQYCTRVYARTSSYEETARRLKLDRRTVKSRVDEALLARLRSG